MFKGLILELLSQDGYYTLNKKLVRLIGLENSFLLSFFIDKYKFFKEEFFYTKENILNDTRLTEYSINNSLKFLKDNELIFIIKKGCPARNYYDINFSKIEDLLKEEIKEKLEENSATSTIENTTTSDLENTITSDPENTITSDPENTMTYNKNKISKNKEVRTNKEKILKEDFENENFEENEIQENETLENENEKLNNQNQTKEQTQNQSQEQTPTVISKLSNPLKQLNKEITKTNSIKNDPNYQDFLQISNGIKQLIETQKRINISDNQVSSWAVEISKLYKSLESARGSENAIYSMFLMINTLNADIHYEDKYKPVIESGKSFREKFIKIEDYYKRRQMQYMKQKQEDDWDDLVL